MSECKPYIALCLASVFLLSLPFAASARLLPQLSGSVNLGYNDYELSEKGSNTADIESFYQRYSLVAKKRGNIYNRRGGPYRLTLTYDHLEYLTDINGSEYSPSSSSLGWDGELKLDMPHLYGLSLAVHSSSERDMAPIYPAFGVSNLARALIYDMNISDSKESGFNLRLGTNGGPYYHFYGYDRETLFDYGAPSSFNRLGMGVQYDVNWIHAYRDRQGPGGLERRTLVVGNVTLPAVIAVIPERSEYGTLFITGATSVSNSMAAYAPAYAPARLWYRLTNWLDISADFYYSEEESDEEEDLSTNSLTVAMRGDLGRTSIGTYSVRERILRESQSKQLLRLPFWADSSLAPGVNLYFSNYYSDTETKDLATDAVSRSRKLDDSLILTSIANKNLLLETGYTLKKSAALGMGLESHSIYLDIDTMNKGINYSLFYRYDTESMSDATYDGRTSYSHLFDGAATYSLTPQLRFRLSQGYLSVYNRNYMSYELFNTAFRVDYESFRGNRSYLDIVRTNRLNENSTEAVQHFMRASFQDDINRQLQLKIALEYNNNREDNLDGTVTESSNLMSGGTMLYRLKRDLESQTRLETSKTDTSPGGSQSKFELEEEVKYSYYRKGFNAKKLFDLTAGIMYRKMEYSHIEDEENWLEMGINYYPTRALSCGAVYISESASKKIAKNAYLAFNYPLLTLRVSYIQQLSEGAGSKEDLYNIDLTKRF